MHGREIFLSYSSKDDAIARLALEKLEAAGHRCWFAPRDIPPGEFYAGQIIQALRESRFVLLFFSAHSNASEQVVREINFAVSQRLPMLVARLDQTVLSNDFEYLIRINQWLDLTHLSSNAERVAQIVAGVQAALAESGPKTSSVKAPVAMIFGDFEILADSSGKPIELGRGGMGVTYRARQISMGGREVALKVIQPELLGDDNIRRRFLREAKLAGDLDHENVALVYSRGQEGDSFYYAMQLVPGTDLDRYIKTNGPLSVREALGVTAQVASALEAASAKGLIHRDIKPSNLMAQRRRTGLRVKLIDFGLAKDIRQREIQSSILSGRDEFKGTLAFASPEQCKSQPLDTRSDLYSLGVTLWFLLTGKVPFRGSVAEVSGAHIYAPPPIQELSSLPAPVVELLQALLSKNPAERPQTPAELHDRIQDLLSALPAEPPSDPVERTPVVNEPVASAADPSSTLIGAPALFSYLEPAVGQIREERFELLEAFPEGVSGRLFRARERRGQESRIAALKFLHPSILAEEEAAESVKSQFAALQKFTLDHLVSYFALELGSKPPFLVREWVQGLPLTGVLRLKTGTLTPSDVSTLLEPLPGLLDGLASSGLSLISVRLSKLWARFPPDLEPAKSESWVKQAAAQDWNSRLALDPLSLRSLVSRPVQSESDMTLLPTSRSLILQQNRAGIQGRTPGQLLAAVVYELLGGQPPQTDHYRPLAAIPETANQQLKHALAHGGPDQSSASVLWLSLKTDFPQARKAPKPTRQQHTRPAPSTGSTPQTPTKRPTKPGLPRTPDRSGPQKTNRTRPWLILGSFAALICIILLGFRLSSHGPTPTANPTPTPSNDKLEEKRVTEARPTPRSTPVASEAPSTSTQQYVVKAGDTLYSISQMYYGKLAPAEYILAANKDKLPGWSNWSFNQQLPPGITLTMPVVRDQQNSTATPTPTPSNNELVTATFNSGLAAALKGHYQTAIADYSEAIRLNPNFADAFNARGYIYYYHLKQYDRAIGDFSEAIRLKPDHAQAYRNRADCYDALGKKVEARRDRVKAEELEKRSSSR